MSWMDILFQSLAVVIPTLLGSLAEKFNNPLIEVDVPDSDKTLSGDQRKPSK
jgi:hypothetical protein